MSAPTTFTATATDRTTPEGLPPTSGDHYAPIGFTRFTNDSGLLTKRAQLDDNGALALSSAAYLTAGRYETGSATSIVELGEHLPDLTPNQAVGWGVSKTNPHGIIRTATVVAAGTVPDAIARTKEHFEWSDGPGFLMIDLDVKDALPHLPQLPDEPTIEELRKVLIEAVPALGTVPMLGLPSASAYLYRTSDGKCFQGLTGARLYVAVTRARDIPEIGRRLIDRLVLAGYGFAFVSRSGLVTLRTLVDASVWSPERLDFVGGASCGDGVEQRRGIPQVWNADAPTVLTLDSIKDVVGAGRERLIRLTSDLLLGAADRAAAARTAWRLDQTAQGRTVDARWPALQVQHDGREPRIALGLLHEIVLTDGTTVTVADVLANPTRFIEQTCHDPLEPDYLGGDGRLARIYQNAATGQILIHSFAHGGAVFTLGESLDDLDVFTVSGETSDPVVANLPQDDHLTDMGNAARFAQHFAEALQYTDGEWMEWDLRRWARCSAVRAETLAKEVARKQYAAALALPSSNKGEIERRKNALSWALRSEGKDRLKGMIDLARGELSINSDCLDADPFRFNVANGTIDLRTGTLHPHRSTDRITKISNVPYSETAECPIWCRFLEQTFDGDAEMINGFQRMIGYTLTGSTSEQVLFLLHGTGANGKSTALETFRDLLGDYAMQANFKTFLTHKGEGPRNDIARLRGARLVTAAEVSRGKELDETVVKTLTGGDRVTARFLYREEFEYAPQFKVWLAANHKPEVRGNDPAIWRRMRLIPFAVTIPDHERDPNLRKALAAELPGILRWAIEGCLTWQREGLGLPAAVKNATANYRAELDILAAFIGDACRLSPTLRVGCTDLFAAYSSWAADRSDTSLTVKEFSSQLETHDPGLIRKLKTNGIKVWQGVGLSAVEDLV